MFSSISWQTYLTILACLIGGYYGIASLLLYYREIVAIAKSRSISLRSEQTPQEEVPDEASTSIIGSAAPEPTPSIQPLELDSDALSLAASDTQEPDTIHPVSKNQPANLVVGSVSDLLQEIKTLIQLCEEYQSAKEECASLFNASFLKYPHLKGTTYQHAISAYVCEESKDHLPFALTLPEVQQWWT